MSDNYFCYYTMTKYGCTHSEKKNKKSVLTNLNDQQYRFLLSAYADFGH